jgi:uncharacterized damage-inducible protein DinB
MTQNHLLIDPDTLKLLWDYMIHADLQMLKAAGALSLEACNREQGISAGSVHKLLVHCMDAQGIWLERLKGAKNPPLADPARISSDELLKRWPEQHSHLRAFAAEQTIESLNGVLRFRTRKNDPFELTRGACMLHVADHSTYHRGQLNSMIKLAGGTPSNIMLFTWSIEQGFGRAGWSE